MKREAEIKELLISNAIHLIAKGGFEAATTKALTTAGGSPEGFKMNEVYIYRFFGSKEKIYEAAFLTLDEELRTAFIRAVEEVGGFETNTQDSFHIFFSRIWAFLLGNEDRFRCYLRYYYSIYFKDSSLQAHKKNFAAMVSSITPLFKDDAAIMTVLHSIFTSLLNLATQVYNGGLEDNETTRSTVFNILYLTMSAYFKDEIKETQIKGGINEE